jgi:hypothetical protein
MTSATAGSRTVQVERLSARAELLAVVRAAMAIAVVVWMFLASQFTGGSAPAGRRNLLPFQKLVADRSSVEQRMFRELQEALAEAERGRSTAGAWPDVEMLAADGVPPFAVDPTRRERYTWTRVQAGTIVNYLGVPVAASSTQPPDPSFQPPAPSSQPPAWLLFVQEPEPGVPPDQTFEDEEHHRLPSGAMLHVSTWVHQQGVRVATRLVRLPQAEGWTQLYAVGPSGVPAASQPAR